MDRAPRHPDSVVPGLLLGVEAGRCRASPLPDRLHTWLWCRAGVRLPAEWWTGALSAFHATDFVAPPLARARLILTVHDLSFLRVPERAHPGLRRFLGRQVPKSVARAAQVLADSRSTRDDLVQLLSVPPERVSVAYPGVSAAMGRVSDPARLARVAAAHGLDLAAIQGSGHQLLGDALRLEDVDEPASDRADQGDEGPQQRNETDQPDSPLFREGEHFAEDELVVLGNNLDDDRLDGPAHLPGRDEDLAEHHEDREAQGDQGKHTVEGERGGRVEIAVPHERQEGKPQDDRGGDPPVPVLHDAACRLGTHGIFSGKSGHRFAERELIIEARPQKINGRVRPFPLRAPLTGAGL